jgi:hypothetical protein
MRTLVETKSTFRLGPTRSSQDQHTPSAISRTVLPVNATPCLSFCPVPDRLKVQLLSYATEPANRH